MRVIATSRTPSHALLRACAELGVGVAVRRVPHATHRALARRIARFDGQIVLITGPSGSGKSSLLRQVALAASAPRPVAPDALPDRPAIDIAHRAAPGEALPLLARVGLAEAPLLGRTPRQLSEGQRWRLALAAALGAASHRGGTLIVDEFASLLDRVAAAAIARAVRRLLAGTPCTRLVCATSHDDLLPFLGPEMVVRLDLTGGARVFTPGGMR